jgi:hypothetical protein
MIKQGLSRFGVRLPLALVASAAAIAVAAVLATSGSAQTTPTTMQFVGKAQNKVGFFPKHRPHQGDRFGFGDKVSGDDTGIDRGVCTFIGKQSLCDIQIQLSKGTMSLQGFVSQSSHAQPLAITGGTGAYNGARGTAIATQASKSTTNIAVTLVP